jgi:hypothetical protein
MKTLIHQLGCDRRNGAPHGSKRREIIEALQHRSGVTEHHKTTAASVNKQLGGFINEPFSS